MINLSSHFIHFFFSLFTFTFHGFYFYYFSDINKRTTKNIIEKQKKIISEKMSQGSLLKYDNPVLVSRNDEKKSPASKKFAAKDDIQCTGFQNKKNKF